MATITKPQDTTFSFDILGRYGCNTLDEALSSMDSSKHPDARSFDSIIIGGGSFGAVLAARLFNLDTAHAHRILVIEAGPLSLPEHVQNLPPGFSPPNKGQNGTVWGQPWVSDSPQTFNQGFPGLAYSIGGRSLFWGGWSPYLIDSELSDASWPANVRKDLSQKVLPPGTPTESYLDRAARQIGTDTTNDFVFGPLHSVMRDQLFTGLSARTPAPGKDNLTGNRGVLNSAGDLEAPLAVQSSSNRPGFFPLNKFNGVQLLLRAARLAQAEAELAAPGGPDKSDPIKRLMVVDNCYVARIERSGGRITRVFVKYQGVEKSIDVPVAGRVFLALGTIENTRLALTTVPEKNLIGRNLMAHLRSNLTFRVPRAAFGDALDPNKEPDPIKKQLLKELQVSALFVKGIHTHKDGSKGHYHLQITASGVGEQGMNSEAELFRKIPNIDELDQFRDLTDKWVVITLRGIGEMVGDKTSNDPMNRITLDAPDGNGVPRAKIRLETNWKDASDPRITDPTTPIGTKENDLWQAMDEASREVALLFAAGGQLQYLSRPNDPDNSVWQSLPPGFTLCRDTLSSTHHESGTLWMGDSAATSVTDEWGRIWETDNLYAVGPCLLPTMGSPNPMLSGVALARRTADHLFASPTTPALEPGFVHLFDGTEKTFQRWRGAGETGGANYFALLNGQLIAQPIGDHAILYYGPERFGDFTLRLQFRLTGPVDLFGKAIGNSGVFLRFRQPHRQWADVNQRQPKAPGNAAWVAVETGFEVQIDEQGRPNFYDKNRTGAIYDVPNGQTINGVTEPQDQNWQPGPILQPGKWYEYEIEVSGDAYTVRLKEDGAAAFQTISTFIRSPAKYPTSGLPPSVNEFSGYIGIQAHPGDGSMAGHIAFRNIRIKQ